MVIPQQLRVELGIEPGDEVEMWRDGDGVRLRVVAERTSLYGRFAADDLFGDLARERAAEREKDENRWP